VRAGVFSTSPRMKSACFSTRSDRRSPPCFFAAALPPNRAAARQRDIPCAIASTTRCRRSTESARAMHAGLPHQHAPSITSPRRWKSTPIQFARKML
jgi:hypothetical protein